ncbi:MAG: CPBP family intramembrane metalloprotease [Acidobacteria bacterium]|nr:CPBP family intramembrane metalloprotease [Acidobacteriota bacterium]MCI0567197.1 CPBP family intramembrane metalloprotease [Acidobacteriota bacterium]
MNATEAATSPRLRLGLLLWSASLLGAATVTVTVLPLLAGQVPLPAPLWLISVASLFQSALLLALAVWGGVALAAAVGLRAPAFEAAATRLPIMPALRPQLLPGLLAGAPGGLLLFCSLRFLPAALSGLQERYNPPLLARLLYGGITEEVLLRWGLMTAFAWLAWRFLQRRHGAMRLDTAWLAIAASALVFGLGHLPVALFLVGRFDPGVVVFVIGVNTAFGCLFGFLYWRWGLESAMIAHGMTHLVNELANQL